MGHAGGSARPRAAALAVLLGLALGGLAATPASAGPPAAQRAATAVRTTVATVATAAPAAPQESDGLRVKATTAYRVDLEESVVRVTHRAELTNQLPDRVSGGMIREFYFHSYSLPVPADATALTARRGDGTRLQVRRDPGGGEFYDGAVVSLSPALYYGRTQTVEVSYELAPQPPRSGTATQVNEAFATFPVFPVGDPGLASLRVVIPDDVAIDVVGSTLPCESDDGTTVCKATSVDDPFDWFATVVARDDDALVERRVAFGTAGVFVQAWPDDSAWLDFTADLAERGLPALEATIGRRWSNVNHLNIVETTAPYLYGYAGWYQRSNAVIEVGDELDAHVILHEMAHAWFNEEMFEGRWINEALAEEISAVAMAEIDFDRPLPKEPDTDSRGAQPLNSWTVPSGEDSQARRQEEYGYAASWWLAHALVEEIGTEAMAEVLGAARDRDSAYPSMAADSSFDGTADWRTLLDLLEEVGGSAEAEQLFRDLVVVPEDRAVLDSRAAARASFATAEQAGGTWSPPAALRHAMREWRFADAEAMVADVVAGFAERDRIATTLAGIGEDVPKPLQGAVEGAGSIAKLERVLADAGDAADALAEAVTAESQAGPVARVGLLVRPAAADLAEARDALDDGDYADAQDAALRATDRVAGATRTGVIGLVGLVGLVGLLLGAALAVRRVRRGRAQRQGDALPVLVESA